MKHFGKWLFGGILVLFVLALLGVGAIYLLLRQTLPDDNATKQIAGLGADVEVSRATDGTRVKPPFE